MLRLVESFPMEQEFIFVYGTLRRDIGHAMHQVLARHADFVGEAAYSGRLYDLGRYPALVPAQAPGDRVIGEVYALHPGTRAAALRLLDEYEGCSPAAPAGMQEYRRIKQPVVLDDGDRVEAWVYLYNFDTQHSTCIPSGDYVAYCRAR